MTRGTPCGASPPLHRGLAHCRLQFFFFFIPRNLNALLLLVVFFYFLGFIRMKSYFLHIVVIYLLLLDFYQISYNNCIGEDVQINFVYTLFILMSLHDVTWKNGTVPALAPSLPGPPPT